MQTTTLRKCTYFTRRHKINLVTKKLDQEVFHLSTEWAARKLKQKPWQLISDGHSRKLLRKINLKTQIKDVPADH